MNGKMANIRRECSLPNCTKSGAQPALHFGGSVGNFHEVSFDDVIVLIQPWYNFFANGHR